MKLGAQTSVVGGRNVLSLRGDIDMAGVPELHDAVTRMVRDHHGELIVVDIDGVEICDDAGLGVLLGAAGRAREAGGDLAVVCSGESLRRRLGRTGFDRAVDVASSIADITTST